MNESVLIPNEESVIIAGRTYKIGELSCMQFIQINLLLTLTLFSNQKKLKELKERTVDSNSNEIDTMTIISLLEEKDLCRFFGILIKEDDMNFIEQNIIRSATKGSEIVAIFCEHNDFDSLKKNVLRIVAVFKKVMEKKP